MANLIKSIDCGQRTVKKYRNGAILLTGGNDPLRDDAAIEKLSEYVLESLLSDEQIAELLDVFHEFEVGKAYEIDELVRYDGKLYRVVQAHTSQADWTPDVVPALFTAAVPEGVIPVWVQPTGAHDAYQTGDQVEWPEGSGTIWESTIDANTTEPGTLLPWGYWVEAGN
jgi:hypothetical protein